MGDVVPLISHNIRINELPAGATGVARASELFWGCDVHETFPKGHFDTIVGSDLSAWTKWDGPLLLVTLLQLVMENTQVVLSHTRRPNQLQRLQDIFDPYFSIDVFPSDTEPDATDDAEGEVSSTPRVLGMKVTSDPDDFAYDIKYFDDSGDEGQEIVILILKPRTPLASESKIAELLAEIRETRAKRERVLPE